MMGFQTCETITTINKSMIKNQMDLPKDNISRLGFQFRTRVNIVG